MCDHHTTETPHCPATGKDAVVIRTPHARDEVGTKLETTVKGVLYKIVKVRSHGFEATYTFCRYTGFFQFGGAYTRPAGGGQEVNVMYSTVIKWHCNILNYNVSYCNVPNCNVSNYNVPDYTILCYT